MRIETKKSIWIRFYSYSGLETEWIDDPFNGEEWPDAKKVKELGARFFVGPDGIHHWVERLNWWSARCPGHMGLGWKEPCVTEESAITVLKFFMWKYPRPG